MHTGDREHEQIQNSLKALWCGPLRLEKIEMRLRATEQPVVLQKGGFGEDLLVGYLPRPQIPFGQSVGIAAVLESYGSYQVSHTRQRALHAQISGAHACAVVCSMETLRERLHGFASSRPDDHWQVVPHDRWAELVRPGQRLRYYPVQRLLDVFELCQVPYRVCVVYHQQENFYLFLTAFDVIRKHVARFGLQNKEV